MYNIFVSIGLLWGTLLFSSLSVVGKKEMKRPNIIFIMSDDHAVNAISAYGSSLIETPNIDRLAKQGMLFKNCFCTNSICSPSRASIMTGKYSHIHGVKTNYVQPGNEHVTYPELLKEAGYQTALVGKTHFGTGTNCIQSMDYYLIHYGVEYHNPKFLEKGKEIQNYEGYVTDIVTDKGIEWIKKCDKSKPFMLMLHHPAPHMPFQEKDELLEVYNNKNYPTPPSFDDPDKNKGDSPRPFNITMQGLLQFQERKESWGKYAWEAPDNLEGEALKKWVYQRYMRAYMACVQVIDENVGKLLDFLKKSGLDENTVVIYTSDQGFFLGEHGWFDKRFFYEESIHMPLIISYPGLKGDQRCEKMVLNVDLPETFLDIAGVSIPGDMQGKSLLPLLSNPKKNGWRDAMYYHYYENNKDSPLPVWRHYGIRTERYKLIRFYHENIDYWELFDLKKDQYERQNLYHSEKYKKQVELLKEQLINLRKFYNDTTDVEIKR